MTVLIDRHRQWPRWVIVVLGLVTLAMFVVPLGEYGSLLSQAFSAGGGAGVGPLVGGCLVLVALSVGLYLTPTLRDWASPNPPQAPGPGSNP